MARSALNLKIELDNVHCWDEGDGWGNAEPYLWPIFFKIDGDNYAVETGSGLIGFPVIESRNGHHGNLGNTDVDAGDDVPIPEALGVWQSDLKPIPVNDPFLKGLIGDDLPGIAGVAVILMEEDGWPDDLADTGYTSLISSITLAVAQVAAGFQHATHAPTKEEIDAAIQTVKATAAGMVHDAIKGTMSGWQLLWYGTFGNNDDTIGSEVWTFDHDDFTAQAVRSIDRRWSGDESGDGDWEITGAFTGVVPCPADALSTLLGQRQAHMSALAAMRDYRDKDYKTLPGLALWWQALSRGAPDLVRIAAGHEAMRCALDRLFASVPVVLAHPNQPLMAEHLAGLNAVLTLLSTQSSWLHKAFARRALAILPELHGRSWTGAVRRIAAARPTGRRRC